MVKNKLTLVIFGLFLFLLILELGLRLAGFLLLSSQEYRNLKSIKQKGAYRILCLGESTTFGQYPALLETELNRRNPGIKFSVIDKGLPSINTAVILDQLESNLDKYHPDLVTVMMGVNDIGPHLPYESISASKTVVFLKSLKIYKCARFIWLRILNKGREGGFTFFDLGMAYAEPVLSEEMFKRAVEFNPHDDAAYTGLGWIYQNQGKFSLAERMLKKAVAINPGNSLAYAALGAVYQDQGRFAQSEAMLKKAIELNPQSDFACAGLGWVYQNQGKIRQAEEMLLRALEINPENDVAYAGLGWIYEYEEKFPQAEAALKKAIELNPGNDAAYIASGQIYQEQGKLPQAEEAFKKAIAINPRRDAAYLKLGAIYQSQGKFSEVEAVFKEAVRQNPENGGAYTALSLLYERSGKSELAEEYAGKAKRLRSGYYNPITAGNFRKLRKILDAKGVRLVCVQYPLRAVEPLKKVFFGDAAGIIFVDNEMIFRDAVKREGYSAYFKDMFGVDFGHCTPKGNRLLAENIASVISREVFHAPEK